MLLTKLTITFVAFAAVVLAAPSPDADLVDRTHYLQHFAPIQVQRLQDYRSTHGLTTSQNALLDEVTDVANTADFSRIDQLKTRCEALFGPEESHYLLTGDSADQTHNAAQSTWDKLKRQADCTCTTHGGCSGRRLCQTPSDGCYRHKGCGLLWLFVCNGICYMAD